MLEGICMKVTVTIDPHFQEEGVAITGPQPSERIQKVQQFIEELDQKERLRAKKEGETYLVGPTCFIGSILKTVKSLGKQRMTTSSSPVPSTNSLKTCPSTF